MWPGSHTVSEIRVNRYRWAARSRKVSPSATLLALETRRRLLVQGVFSDSPLADLGTRRQLLVQSEQRQLALVGGGQHHPVGLDAHERGGLQVGDDDHRAPHEV